MHDLMNVKRTFNFQSTRCYLNIHNFIHVSLANSKIRFEKLKVA